MPMSPDQARARAQIAARRRWHGNDAEITELRQDLDDATERARLDDHVKAIIAGAPRLTAEQADSLRPLVQPFYRGVRAAQGDSG